jgi:hypothetical protein
MNLHEADCRASCRHQECTPDLHVWRLIRICSRVCERMPIGLPLLCLGDMFIVSLITPVSKLGQCGYPARIPNGTSAGIGWCDDTADRGFIKLTICTCGADKPSLPISRSSYLQVQLCLQGPQYSRFSVPPEQPPTRPVAARHFRMDALVTTCKIIAIPSPATLCGPSHYQANLCLRCCRQRDVRAKDPV